jgi:hypothetical protein
MKPIISMRHALYDSDLFAPILEGDSWAAWRMLLIALVGEELTPEERTVFAGLTGRPQEPRKLASAGDPPAMPGWQ